MRRLLGTTALLGLAAPVLVLVPAVSPRAAARPHPVAPSVRALDVPAATARLHAGSTRFDTFGASWAAGATGTVQVRSHDGSGWSAWTTLEARDNGPDPGTREDHGRATVVSEPVWAGPSDAAEVRAVGGAVPRLRLTLVDSGTSAADADPAGTATGAGTASASEAQPAVYSRAQWGADESLRTYNSGCGTPEYSSTIKVGFVHHTDTPNDYSSSQVPSIIRGIYAYHVKSNGWCDIGYNFLVDRFGRTWEGRYGGIARPVIGAHTGGFNTDSFGTSLIGTYTSVTPSTATQAAVARLFAWKLGLHHADPLGRATLISAGGPNTKYPAGQAVTFNVVAGHRDVGYTTCPGDAAYGRLPAIRSATRTDMGSALFDPASSARSQPWAGSPVTVTARVPETQSWRLDVQRSADRSVVRTITGTASSSLTATFDLKDRTGAWLPPGGYTLNLTSAAGSDAAVPWSTPFDITTTSSSPPAAGTTPPAPASFVPVTPVRVLDTRSGLGSDVGAGTIPAQGRVEATVLGKGQVPSTGVAGVVVNLTGIAHAGPTYLSAYPAEDPWPGTSSVNLAGGQVHAALVTLGVGSSGRVSVYNGSSTADAVLDVVGYFPVTGGSSYTAVTPSRLLDTRVSRTPFSSGEVRSVAVAGKAGVPSGATAVVLNATVTGAASHGLLSVFPAGSTRPPTSTLNFDQGEVTSNRVFSGLSSTGTLSVYAQATKVDVVLDVVGYYSSSASGSRFTPVTPSRVLDTRSANGVPGTSPVADGSTTVVKLAGRGGVPTSATAVLVTLTTTGTTHDGYVTGWSGVGPRPLASDVNTRSHRTVANLAVLALNPSTGTASLYNAGGSAHLIGDVLGYLAPPAPAG